MQRKVKMFFKTLIVALFLSSSALAQAVINPQTDASKLITGTLPAARLPLTSAVLQASPSNPTGTASVNPTQVHMGLGSTCTITPVYSGRVNLRIIGVLVNSLMTGIGFVNVKYGTGTAPTNGAASTGTSLGAQIVGTSDANGSTIPFSAGGIITGLTPGTAYWFDLILAVNGGNGSTVNINCNAQEF